MRRGCLGFPGVFVLLIACTGAGDPGDGRGSTPDAVLETATRRAQPDTVTVSESLATRTRLIVYRPRLTSRADVRVKPGDRGGTLPAYLTVLAPPHTGFTTRMQPTLYWYVESPPGLELAVSLTVPGAMEPLLEQRLTPVAAGIQSLSLADHGVRLEPGVAYQWHVALVVNPDHRSQDLLSTGAIQTLVDAGEPPTGAPVLERARWYAANGFWYDALAVLQAAAEAGDAVARAARQELLAQGELADVNERL